MLAQPKRLALLAYLAARRPGEPVRRDRILATFWPELPTGRAQGNLRNALYYQRSQLGPGVIAGHGATARISADRLVCDAAVLLGDTEDVPPDELLAFYRGEFLDAVHLSGAPDFERWVDRTRAALRARATEIAWSQSTRAESSNEWISAARYARRASELAVDVEGATQRLIRLLGRAGDRAAAVAEFEQLASRLDEEFGLGPSPETTALVAELRESRSGDRAAFGNSSRPTRRAPPGSMAVLPFEDLSGGRGAYLAAGVVEDLLTALSRIRDVRVVSRTSVRRFATHPPKSIGAVRDLLGVDLVLEGSVQLHGDRCRITVQLIDARSNEHLWAETYDRDLTDVFEVQSDVVLRIARALEAELSPRDHQRLRRRPTESPRAWQLYLKGRQAWGERDPRAAARAASLFRRALEVDGRFAPAWSGLADALLAGFATGLGTVAEAVRAAREALGRALEYDPELGEAHATLGIILTFFEPDPPAAELEYRRAVELSPGYASAHHWYGCWLCAYGRAEEGLAELTIALDLDPLSPSIGEGMGLGLYHVGRIAEAEAQFRHTLELDPQYWRGRMPLAQCCAHRGDIAAAASQLVAVWEAGGLGATADEAREAARLLERDVEGSLGVLLRGARSRVGQGGMTSATGDRPAHDPGTPRRGDHGDCRAAGLGTRLPRVVRAGPRPAGPRRALPGADAGDRPLAAALAKGGPGWVSRPLHSAPRAPTACTTRARRAGSHAASSVVLPRRVTILRCRAHPTQPRWACRPFLVAA